MELANSLLVDWGIEAKDLLGPTWHQINDFNSDEIKRGDHVAVLRTSSSVAWHHGIYIGDKKMIDFSGPDKEQAKIQELSVYQFFQEGYYVIVVIDYPQNESYTADKTVHNATRLLNLPIKYNIYNANCEYFATFCRCGRYVKNPVSLHRVVPLYPASFK